MKGRQEEKAVNKEAMYGKSKDEHFFSEYSQLGPGFGLHKLTLCLN